MAISAELRKAYDELIEAVQTARALAITYYASASGDEGDDDLCDQLLESEARVEKVFDAWLAAIESDPFSSIDEARDILVRAAMALRDHGADSRVQRRYGAAIAAIDAAVDD